MTKLTPKRRKYVKAKIQGKSNVQAYREAGYRGNDDTAPVLASRLNSKPEIKQAIESALESQGLTPEWAVSQLKKVAEQDKELGAKRLASKDIIELHGWSNKERPTTQLQIKNAFFQSGRKVIDVTEE